MQIEVTATPTAVDREAVFAGLMAFIRAEVGVVATPLGVLVRDDTGQTIGGLIGRTVASWLYVELFWLPETLRGTGVGTRVMMAAEAEAVRRGCIGAHLDTYDYQAPGFYQKLGFEVFGSIDDHPPGHTRFWMRKRFAKADTLLTAEPGADAIAGKPIAD